jgi:hypothetical protein
VITLGVSVLLLLPAASLATDGTTSGAEPDLLAGGQVLDGAPLTELRAQLEDLTLRYDELLADHASLEAALAEVSSERDQLARTLDRFDESYAPMEADRQLLLELRKDTPETRPEAEAQLERIRTLALTADSAHLGQLVDRLGEAAPDYLDWRYGEHLDPAAAAQAYVDSGANAFDSTMSEFRNEVLLSVAGRLDGILTVIDRVR